MATLAKDCRKGWPSWIIH